MNKTKNLFLLLAVAGSFFMLGHHWRREMNDIHQSASSPGGSSKGTIKEVLARTTLTNDLKPIEDGLSVGLDEEDKERYLRIIEEKNAKIKELENQMEDFHSAKTEKERNDVITSPNRLLSEGQVIAEVSETGRELYLMDGIYIKDDNKLLINSELISSGKKSIPSQNKSSISFTNTTGEDLYLFWIDFDGNPTFSGKLSPGDTQGGTTYDGAVHVVTRTDGEIYEYITPIAGVDLIELAE